MTSNATDRLNGVLSSLAIKAPVRVATTANITLSGLQTIDGVSLSEGDRVLVKDQTDSTENGIYVADTSTWQRAADFNGNRDAQKGTFVRVVSGTSNANKAFGVTSNNPITIGSSQITFGNAILSSANGISFLQSGTGAIEREANAKMAETQLSVTDFTSGLDITAALQTIIDGHVGPITITIPRGSGWIISSTIYHRRSGVKIKGEGIGTTVISFVNLSGGTAFKGSTNGTDVLTDCELSGFSLFGDVTTGPSVCIDITNFSYSRFDLSVQTRRPNGVLYQGAGNTGSQPYYNWITGYWFGGSDRTQKGLYFQEGAFGGGSAGPNANIVGPIMRAASLGILCDIESGNGNLFRDIVAESINDFYFRLNNVASYADTGTSTGSNGAITLNNTGKAYTTNQYVNYGIKITGGTGAGQSRIIKSNSATVITVEFPWAVVPDATSTYVIAKNQAHSNKFANIRAEGLATDNPDFISAMLGTYGNRFSNCVVESLGSGLWVRDDSGAVNNTWYDGSKAVFTETISNPGPSANIDVYPRNSVFGGVVLSNYVIEWMSLSINAVAPGDTATARLDVGGTSAGTGSDMTLLAQTSEDLAFAIPSATQKIERDGTNRHVFLNLQTGASFSGTADVTITWCASIDV